MSMYRCPDCGNHGRFHASYEIEGYVDADTGEFESYEEGATINDYGCTECGSHWTEEELRECAKEHESKTA